MLCGWRILRNVCPMPVLLTRGPVYLKYDLGEPGTLFVYTDILLYYPKKNTKAINNVDKCTFNVLARVAVNLEKAILFQRF